MLPLPVEMSWNELFCFIEEVFECEMSAHRLEWKRVGVYGSEPRIYTPAIGYVILNTTQFLSGLTSLEYLTTFTSFDDCHNYVRWYGFYLFRELTFSWHSFRIFLATLGKVGVHVMRNFRTFTADNVVLSTALFVKEELSYCIQNCGGWRAFQLDCTRIVMHQLRRKTYLQMQSPMPSAPSEMASDPLLCNEHPAAMSSPPSRYYRPPVLTNMDNAVQVLPTHYVPNHKLRPVFCFTTEEPA